MLRKIEDDERDIDQKCAENEQLQLKLDQFQTHLQQRRQREENLKQARLLEARLEEAKAAQRGFHLQQLRQKAGASKARVRHLQETVYQLKEQQQLFVERFAEFDVTLVKSDQVVKQLEEREAAMAGMVQSLREEQAELRRKAEQEDVQLIATVELGRLTEADLEPLRTTMKKLEKKCRKLQTQRKELIQEKEEHEKRVREERGNELIGECNGGSEDATTGGDDSGALSSKEENFAG